MVTVACSIVNPGHIRTVHYLENPSRDVPPLNAAGSIVLLALKHHATGEHQAGIRHRSTDKMSHFFQDDPMTLPTPTVLIIGAGLAGLTAARVLRDTSHAALVLDKGRSVGGRMATRRIGHGQADHGAQFFSVRDAAFQAAVDDWLAQHLIVEWARGFSDGSAPGERDGHPRYIGRDGMNGIARALAQGINTRIGVEIASITHVETGWELTDKFGVTYPARALIVTSPVPQSLRLLDNGNVALHPDDRAALDAIQYDPCLAGLIWLNGDVSLPEPGAIQRPEAPISWIADNRAKGLSPHTLITAHINPEYSRTYFDATDETIIAFLREQLAPFIGQNPDIPEIQVKRWRYSQPQITYPEQYLHARDLPPLIFAGDAFGGPRVEGAYLSGLAAGERLRAILSGT
jgi:hypothetical protein